MAELVGAARGGDRQAFDELVRRTYVDTFTLARRLTANEEDASDVVQEAYLRAWKGIGKFRGDAAVHHVALPHHRQLRRQQRASAGAGTGPSPSPTISSPSTSAPSSSSPEARSRPTRSTASRPRVDELPRRAAVGRRVEGRLRPAPRGHRRGARHHGLGRQGPAAPGPAQAAGRVVRRQGRQATCGVTRSPSCCPGLVDGEPIGLDAERHVERACAARPSWPGTGGCCGPCDSCGPRSPSRRPGCSARRSPRSPRRPRAAAPADRCSSGRRLAYAGGDRRRRGSPRVPPPRCSSPGPRKRGPQPGRVADRGPRRRTGRPSGSRAAPVRTPRLSLSTPGPHGPEGSSSTGRAPVSKTGGWGFESLLPCSVRTPKSRANRSRRGDMNRQTKRQMARQGSDRRAGARRRSAAADPQVERTGPQAVSSARYAARCEGGVADRAGDHELLARRAGRRWS